MSNETPEKQFIAFQNADQVNERLKGIDLAKLADAHGRHEGGCYKFDSLGLQLFVNSLLRETFYEKKD